MDVIILIVLIEMEIQEREAFNTRLVRWCINKSLLNTAVHTNSLPMPVSDEAFANSQLPSCLTKVLAAEQVFRADLLQGRPGMPVLLEADDE